MLGEDPNDRISFSTLIAAFEDRAFGALLFIFAIPNVIPLPPGSSAVLGLPLLLISVQLAIGRRTLWLPASVANRTMARKDFQRVVEKVLPILRRLERVMAPRLDVMFGVVGDRLVGLACVIMALILFLPIPFGNMLPGLAVSLFSLALLQRDGLVAIAGWVAVVLSFAALAAVSGAVWLSIQEFVAPLLAPLLQ